MLKTDLQTMRTAIDNYTMDKLQAPQSLQDLADAHYLRELPIDPFTQQRDWVAHFGDTLISPEQTGTWTMCIPIPTRPEATARPTIRGECVPHESGTGQTLVPGPWSVCGVTVSSVARHRRSQDVTLHVSQVQWTK